MGTRHIELEADAPSGVHEVCIHPGLSTTLLFDSKLARVELPGRERFRFMEGEAGLTLIPTEVLREGERVPVTLSFQDGMAPASATLLLVVHPVQAERQVEVTRHPRTLASYREGEQQARAEAQQCREERARLQAGCDGKGGLTGLIAQRLMGQGGIAFEDIRKSVTPRSGNTLIPAAVYSYRANIEHQKTQRQGVRLAVSLLLSNQGTTPWTPAGAVLVTPTHAKLAALTVWPLEPIPPGEERRVVVEVETKEQEARGPFTLKLWSQEGGARGEVFDGVTFP